VAGNHKKIACQNRQTLEFFCVTVLCIVAVGYQRWSCHNPEDLDLNCHRYENPCSFDALYLNMKETPLEKTEYLGIRDMLMIRHMQKPSDPGVCLA